MSFLMTARGGTMEIELYARMRKLHVEVYAYNYTNMQQTGGVTQKLSEHGDACDPTIRLLFTGHGASSHYQRLVSIYQHAPSVVS